MAKQAIKSIIVLVFGFYMNAVHSRDYISVVGSSTVYPFSAVAAETFGKISKFKTPKIESTGSGGGLKLFCEGIGVSTPDITNSSRRIKKSEFDKCHKNGVDNITEVQIGFDGIVIANSVKSDRLNLSRRDIFLALTKNVPTDKDGELVPNPYKTWQQVNADLADLKIEVLGPPPTSGTRDAFTELALEGGCQTFSWIAQLKKDSKAAKKNNAKEKAASLKQRYKEICHTIREDGVYIEAGENDNLIVQKLAANIGALGIFGFSFLDQNADTVHGSLVDGKEPTFENIADGSYPVSRPLYFYIKNAHVGKIPGIQEFALEFTSVRAVGEEGYLIDKGLIPLSDSARRALHQDVVLLKNLEL